jgi:hypothetical protein
VHILPQYDEIQVANRAGLAAGTARAAERVLGESPNGALKGVVCNEFGGMIRLGGHLPSHVLKQLAFAAACQVVGTRPILDEIQVVPAAARRRVDSAQSAASGRFRKEITGLFPHEAVRRDGE